MGMILGERMIQAALTAGLSSVKDDLDVMIPAIFETSIYGGEYISTVKEFLAGNKIRISQGYPLDDKRAPGWFVTPSSVQPKEQFLGDYIDDDSDAFGTEMMGVMNSNSIRVLTASTNMDVTLFLDAIARYILLSAGEDLSDQYSITEYTITATDIDPVLQYLPNNFFYRSIIASFTTMDSWQKVFPIVNVIETYMTITAELEV